MEGPARNSSGILGSQWVMSVEGVKSVSEYASAVDAASQGQKSRSSPHHNDGTYSWDLTQLMRVSNVSDDMEGKTRNHSLSPSSHRDGMSLQRERREGVLALGPAASSSAKDSGGPRTMTLRGPTPLASMNSATMAGMPPEGFSSSSSSSTTVGAPNPPRWNFAVEAATSAQGLALSVVALSAQLPHLRLLH